jgi:histidine triad (HIT) family protein
MADCIFCQIAAGEIPAQVVYEDDRFLAFEDINKQAPVHVQVIPKHHSARLTDLEAEDADLVGAWILAANRVARQMGIAEPGYRLVLNCNAEGGQEVFHIHLHIMGGRKMTWPPG